MLPGIGERTVTAWTPADSSAVIAAVRRAGGSDSLVQDVSAVMRALVTHARRLRWLTAQSEDPMWMVRYAKKSAVQGAASIYVPRSALPTDDDRPTTALQQCSAVLAARRPPQGRRPVVAPPTARPDRRRSDQPVPAPGVAMIRIEDPYLRVGDWVPLMSAAVVAGAVAAAVLRRAQPER